MKKQKNTGHTMPLGVVCWGLKNWPADVWPHTTAQARTMLRTRTRELVKYGALTRKGRQLVFLGAEYMRWLRAGRSDVVGYEIAPNRKREKIQKQD